MNHSNDERKPAAVGKCNTWQWCKPGMMESELRLCSVYNRCKRSWLERLWSWTYITYPTDGGFLLLKGRWMPLLELYSCLPFSLHQLGFRIPSPGSEYQVAVGNVEIITRNILINLPKIEWPQDFILVRGRFSSIATLLPSPLQWTLKHIWLVKNWSKWSSSPSDTRWQWRKVHIANLGQRNHLGVSDKRIWRNQCCCVRIPLNFRFSVNKIKGKWQLVCWSPNV